MSKENTPTPLPRKDPQLMFYLCVTCERTDDDLGDKYREENGRCSSASPNSVALTSSVAKKNNKKKTNSVIRLLSSRFWPFACCRSTLMIAAQPESSEQLCIVNIPPPPPETSEDIITQFLHYKDTISSQQWMDEGMNSPRILIENRGVSVEFLKCINSAYERIAKWHRISASDFNSYVVIGDKNSTGGWQTNFGLNPYECEPWCLRNMMISTELSFVETLVIASRLIGDPKFEQDDQGFPYFAKATHFVSHFWASPFNELVHELEHYPNIGDSKPYFWVDLFAVGQCRHTETAKQVNTEDISELDHARRVTRYECKIEYHIATSPADSLPIPS